MAKKTFHLISALFGIAVLGCGPGGMPLEVKSIFEEVRQIYAPDKRVALFNLEIQPSGRRLRLIGETNLPAAKKVLMDKLEAAGYELEDSSMVLPAAGLEGKHFGVVRLSACNIRSEPKHSAELATQATLGTPLRVYKQEGDWFLVQTPDGYISWLDKDGFTLMDRQEYDAWMSSEKVVYLPEFGFSFDRSGPAAGHVTDLLAGNILRLSGMEGAFAKVLYPDGRSAFVNASEVMNYEQWLASREPDAENIINTAFGFMGRPYLWGGTSGKGVDCSGFTKTVFYLNGLLLPRDASQQVNVGVEIPTDSTLRDLQAGDLLFFGRRATVDQKERVTHVAIYLGEGKIIHSAGTVRVQSLRPADPDFAEDRLKTFLRAKRVLSASGKEGVELLRESTFYQVLAER